MSTLYELARLRQADARTNAERVRMVRAATRRKDAEARAQAVKR